MATVKSSASPESRENTFLRCGKIRKSSPALPASQRHRRARHIGSAGRRRWYWLQPEPRPQWRIVLGLAIWLGFVDVLPAAIVDVSGCSQQ